MNWMTDLAWGLERAAAPALHHTIETLIDVSRLDARRVIEAIEAHVGTFRVFDGGGVAVVSGVDHAHPNVVVRSTVPAGASLDIVLRDERPELEVRLHLLASAFDAVLEALGTWTRPGPVHAAVSPTDVWVDAGGWVTVDGFGLLASWCQLSRARVASSPRTFLPEPVEDLRAGSADAFALGVLVGAVALGVPEPMPGGVGAWRTSIARRLEASAPTTHAVNDSVLRMLDANPALARLFGGSSTEEVVARVERRVARGPDTAVLAELARVVLAATEFEPRARLRPETLFARIERLVGEQDPSVVARWRDGCRQSTWTGVTRRRPTWIDDDLVVCTPAGSPSSPNRELRLVHGAG